MNVTATTDCDYVPVSGAEIIDCWFMRHKLPFLQIGRLDHFKGIHGSYPPLGPLLPHNFCNERTRSSSARARPLEPSKDVRLLLVPVSSCDVLEFTAFAQEIDDAPVSKEWHWNLCNAPHETG